MKTLTPEQIAADLEYWDREDTFDRELGIVIEWQLRRSDGTVWQTHASKRAALAYGRYRLDAHVLFRLTQAKMQLTGKYDVYPD